MAIEQLLARLEQDAEGEAEALVGEARARAGEIVHQAAAAQATRRAGALVPDERRLREDAEGRRVRARRDARREILLARRALVERVMNAARLRLPAELRNGRYASALPAHLGEALAYLEGRAVTVRCPEALVEAVRALGGDRADLDVIADPDAGSGIVVDAADGSVTIDNTLEARLERIADGLALDLIARAGAE